MRHFKLSKMGIIIIGISMIFVMLISVRVAENPQLDGHSLKAWWESRPTSSEIRIWYQSRLKGTPALVPAWRSPPLVSEEQKWIPPASWLLANSSDSIESMNLFCDSEGHEITAIANGIVLRTELTAGDAQKILIRHAGRFDLEYIGNWEINVVQNNWVSKDQVLATCQADGFWVLRVYQDGRLVDPVDVIAIVIS